APELAVSVEDDPGPVVTHRATVLEDGEDIVGEGDEIGHHDRVEGLLDDEVFGSPRVQFELWMTPSCHLDHLVADVDADSTCRSNRREQTSGTAAKLENRGAFGNMEAKGRFHQPSVRAGATGPATLLAGKLIEERLDRDERGPLATVPDGEQVPAGFLGGDGADTNHRDGARPLG